MWVRAGQAEEEGGLPGMKSRLAPVPLIRLSIAHLKSGRPHTFQR